MNSTENLLPKPRKPEKWKGVVYTEESIFFGAGINKYHYTLDGLKTICGRKIEFFGNWRKSNEVKRGDIGKYNEVDFCKHCLKKLRVEK